MQQPGLNPTAAPWPVPGARAALPSTPRFDATAALQADIRDQALAATGAAAGPVPGATAALHAPVTALAKRQLATPDKAQSRPKAKGRRPAGCDTGRAAAAAAAIEVACIEGPMVPYTWTRPAVKNKDGVVTRQKEVDIEEACALRDDATNVTLPQLKAMVVELRGLHGASAVKGVPGKKKQVLETLARERQNELLRRASSSREDEEQRRRLQMVRNAAVALAAQAGTPVDGTAAADAADKSSPKSLRFAHNHVAAYFQTSRAFLYL
jgi:hypothetical protein